MASFLDTKLHENVESPPSLAVVHVAPATTTARPPPSSFSTFRWGFLQNREINILFFFLSRFPPRPQLIAVLTSHPIKQTSASIQTAVQGSQCRACVCVVVLFHSGETAFQLLFLPLSDATTNRPPLSMPPKMCMAPPPPPPSSPPSPLIIEQPFPLHSPFLLHHHLCLPLPTLPPSLPLLRTQKQTIRQNPSPFSLPLDFFALSLFLRPAIDSQSLSREPTGGVESLNETDAQFLYDVGVCPFLGRIRSTYPVSK